MMTSCSWDIRDFSTLASMRIMRLKNGQIPCETKKYKASYLPGLRSICEVPVIAGEDGARSLHPELWAEVISEFPPSASHGVQLRLKGTSQTSTDRAIRVQIASVAPSVE